MNYEKLICIKESIEKMSKYHQQEILEILKNFKNVILNENNNGVFINLSNLDNEVIYKLEDYISYFNTQQQYIDVIEMEKRSIETNFFDDNEIILSNKKKSENLTTNSSTKISTKISTNLSENI